MVGPWLLGGVVPFLELGNTNPSDAGVGVLSCFFEACDGDVGFGFSGFSSVTTFGLFERFGLSLSIGLCTCFLAAFIVVVSTNNGGREEATLVAGGPPV